MTARAPRRHRGGLVLNDDKVRRIFALVASGTQQRIVAQQFGVSPALICQIIKRKKWAHVEILTTTSHESQPQ